MQGAKIVAVRSYGSRPEADLAKGVLENAGIQAMIKAGTAGGMREHLAGHGAGFKILVREEDAIEARTLLAPPAEDDLCDASFKQRPSTFLRAEAFSLFTS